MPARVLPALGTPAARNTRRNDATAAVRVMASLGVGEFAQAGCPPLSTASSVGYRIHAIQIRGLWHRRTALTLSLPSCAGARWTPH